MFDIQIDNQFVIDTELENDDYYVIVVTLVLTKISDVHK